MDSDVPVPLTNADTFQIEMANNDTLMHSIVYKKYTACMQLHDYHSLLRGLLFNPLR